MGDLLGRLLEHGDVGDLATEMAVQQLHPIQQAAGLELFVDNIRTADEDNPKGYFEYEPVKELADAEAQLEQCVEFSTQFNFVFLNPKDANYSPPGS